MQKIDKDNLKNMLSIEDVFNYVTELGGEPKMMNGFFISHTICHNPPGTGSYKLYYYDNTHLFRCYTDCDDTWDIYELTLKIKKMQGKTWSLNHAIYYVAEYFGYNIDADFSDVDFTPLQDWHYLDQYDRNREESIAKIIDLKIYNENILKYLPQLRILPWEQEGINNEIIQRNHILYDPLSLGIVIPHYDKDNQLIGIRERTLNKEKEQFGKYRPAIINGQIYNHPLSFNLYNLNNSKNNIKQMRTAIVFEGEKSTLKYASLFGQENDISVAVCGSSLISYQVHLLLQLGITEIVIAFDKQFQKIGDDEFKRWVKKLININNKYSSYINISFMFDRTGTLLKYKDSPIDQGKETFLKLFNTRIML